MSTEKNFIPQDDIEFKDSGVVDSFQRLRIGQPFGLFENKFITSDNKSIWETRVFGAIINHGVVTGVGFTIGETITGGTSGTKGTITSVGSGFIVYNTNYNDFIDGETITGGNSLSTSVITNHDTGAHHYYDYNKSSVFLKTGTQINQRVVRQTVRYFPYYSGHSHEIVMTNVFGPAKTGVQQIIMYGDDLNGVGVILDGLRLGVFIRTNTTGLVDNNIKYQNEWDFDRMDGSKNPTLNPSGILLDITKNQINSVDFQWLGVGRVRIGVNINGVLHYVHHFEHANETIGVYMRTPSLPVRYEIKNIGTTSTSTELQQICCVVISEGGAILPGTEFSAPKIANAAERAVTTLTPILAIRLKNEFPAGKPNRKTVRYLDFSASSRVNECWFELAHLHEPISVTANWISADTYSGVEYSIDISSVTAMATHSIQEQYVMAGGAIGQTEQLSAEFVTNHSFINQNYESNNSQMFVIFAKARTGTANVWTHISWIESE